MNGISIFSKNFVVGFHRPLIVPQEQKVQEAAQPAISSSSDPLSQMDLRGRALPTIVNTLQLFNVQKSQASSSISPVQLKFMTTPLDQILCDPLTPDATKASILKFLSFTQLPPNQILSQLSPQSLLQFFISYQTDIFDPI